MPYIAAVGTALPPYIFEQEKVQEFAGTMFGEAFRDIDRLLQVFKGANIHKRHFCVPMEWFEEEHSFSDKNKLYKEWAIRLGTEAARQCIDQSGFTPSDVDTILFVSTTGISTPSVDAYIAQQLRLSTHIRRIPIWGLGCAGGTGGVGRAFELAKANPNALILLVAVELCGLTFIRNDMSKSNLVATSLFGDGAAAVLIAGDAHQHKLSDGSPQVLSSMSTLWENSFDVMGWDVTDEGLKVIFSKDIPSIVHKHMKPNVEEFLMNNSLSIEHISHFITHPGGEKVLQAYAESLQISRDHFNDAAEILTNHGNMSSVTVLFVLNQMLQKQTRNGQYGLMTALGPGFSSELVLLQW